MAQEYLTVDHLTTKELKRIFSKICIHPDLQHDGTPCWIWCNSRNEDGYGASNFKGKGESAHRLLFAWLIHPLPRGGQAKQLDHLCRRPSCCNPLHLEFVSPRENVLRGNGVAAKCARKTRCLNGHELNGDNLIYSTDRVRICRTCFHTRSTAYYEANWDRLHALRMAVKDEHNAKQREFRASIKEEYNADQRRRRVENDYNAQQREYRLKNRDILLAKRREKYHQDKLKY